MSRRELLMGGTQEIMYFLNEHWWVVNPVSTTRILCGTCKYYVWGGCVSTTHIGKAWSLFFLNCWQSLNYQSLCPGNKSLLPNCLSKVATNVNKPQRRNRSITLETILIIDKLQFHEIFGHYGCFMECKMCFNLGLYGQTSRNCITISVHNFC
jgi:hypothetical protein